MPNRIAGKVDSIGANGKLVTSISIAQVEEMPENDSVGVKFAGHETFGIFAAQHEQPESTMVASKGDSGFVEIEIVGMDLAGMLGIKAGVSVEIVW